TVRGRLAMKVLRKVGTLAQTHELLGEAVLLSRLGHPNVVRVFDAGTVTTAAGERGWFTMEYVAGGNLDDYRTAHTAGPLPVADSVEILRQLCAGLAAAHGEDPPIVHRDLTPWNILVGQDAHGIRVRIGDFGLARRAQPGLTGGEGTLAFMAPEALRYGVGSSTAADVYSVGVLAYLLLTDVLPHRDLAHTVYGAERRRPPAAPSRLNRAADAALDRACPAGRARSGSSRPRRGGTASARRRRPTSTRSACSRTCCAPTCCRTATSRTRCTAPSGGGRPSRPRGSTAPSTPRSTTSCCARSTPTPGAGPSTRPRSRTPSSSGGRGRPGRGPRTAPRPRGG